MDEYPYLCYFHHYLLTLEPGDVTEGEHVVLVDQATRHGSASTVIAGDVAEEGFSSLKAPIKQVTALDATIAYSQPMEEYLLPDEDRVVGAVQQVLGQAPVGG